MFINHPFSFQHAGNQECINNDQTIHLFPSESCIQQTLERQTLREAEGGLLLTLVQGIGSQLRKK